MGYSNSETFTLSDNYKIITYSSKSFWKDNLSNYGKNNCRGIVKIDKDGLFDGGEVYCESIDQNKYKFTVKLFRNKGDFNSGIGHFIVIDGQGPWKNFVGKKCTYAIQYIEEGFIRIDKCFFDS